MVHQVLKLSRLASVSKLPVPFLISLNIQHTNLVVLTCAHPKWQNSQSEGRIVNQMTEAAQRKKKNQEDNSYTKMSVK